MKFRLLVLGLLLICIEQVAAVQYIAPSNNANQSFGYSNLLFLDNTNGRLGVNMSTPTQALDVKGNVNISGVTYFGPSGSWKVDPTSGQGTFGYMGVNYLNTLGSQLEIATASAATPGARVRLSASQSANALEVLNSVPVIIAAINGSGAMTLGAQVPTQQLHVQGNANVTGIIYTPQICLNGTCQSSWPSGGGANATAIHNGTSGYVPFLTNATNMNASLLFYDVGNKRIGINTTGPTQTLDVRGNINTSGILYAPNISVSGALISVNGTITGTLEWNGKPWIKSSAGSVANTDSDATKDAQCVTDLGSAYVAATANDYYWYMSPLDPNGNLNYVNVAGSTNSYIIASRTGGTATTTTQELCIQKYAPVRFTRSTYSTSNSGGQKDSDCATEFGPNYATARTTDLYLLPTFYGTAGLLTFQVHDSSNFLYTSGYGQTLSLTAGSTGSASQLCLHK